MIDEKSKNWSIFLILFMELFSALVFVYGVKNSELFLVLLGIGGFLVGLCHLSWLNKALLERDDIIFGRKKW